jgi:hypothetical protein
MSPPLASTVRPASRMARRDAVLLVVLGALWGSVYPLTTVVLRELSPPAVVLVRTGLSAPTAMSCAPC